MGAALSSFGITQKDGSVILTCTRVPDSTPNELWLQNENFALFVPIQLCFRILNSARLAGIPTTAVLGALLFIYLFIC